MQNNRPEPNVCKGMIAGLVAGVVASWAMDCFQHLWLSSSPGDNVSESDNDATRQRAPDLGDNQAKARTASNNESVDDATRKAASAISETVFGHELSPEEKQIAGPAIHYAVGAASGIAYGVAAEFVPAVTAGLGLPYGTAFWLTVDEGAVPLLGLSKGPMEYSVSTHIYALASHLVFGFTAELVRRAVRATV